MGVKFSNTNPAAPGGQTLATIQKDPVTGEVSVAYTPGSGGSTGGVNAQTTSYLALSSDDSKLISMNGSSITLTLPSPPPSTTWKIFVENINASSLSIDPNGLTLDGSGSILSVAQDGGLYISTDGTNYFSERGLGTGGSGTVTHTGALTANQVVIGNGAADIKVLASPSDATEFLNGAATPAFAKVKDSDLSLSNITTNDVSITKHGFAPILPNDATKFLDGTGAYSVPSGSGGPGAGTTVSTSSMSYTANQTINFNLTMAKSFLAWTLTEATGKKFRLRLYSTSAARTADANRPFTIPLPLGTSHQCILDMYLDQINDVTPFILSPVGVGSNGDVAQTTTIYAAVTNIDTATQTIVVTISYVPLES